MRGSDIFLSVAHGFFIEECGERSTEDDLSVTQCLSRFLNNAVSAAVVSAEISQITGSQVEFMTRIQEILTVPDDPPLVMRLTSLTVNGRREQHPWTRLEDNRLLRAIHKFGLDDWGEVIKFVGMGRSRAQCRQRWNRGLNPLLRKRPWSPDEERQLRALVTRHGPRAWTRIAGEMEYRSDAQCRYHFQQMQKRDNEPKNPPGVEEPTAEMPADGLDLEMAKMPSTENLFSSPQFFSLFPQEETSLINSFFF
jgi:hypothetical protein